MTASRAHGDAADRSPELLRFLTCGSVDDGKSTLIGRLLFDAGLVPEDQRAQLSAESRRRGSAENDVDVSLLLDGLDDERQQRITIDVAYRFFARRGGPLSSPTRRDTSNTPATWRPAPRPPNSP